MMFLTFSVNNYLESLNAVILCYGFLIVYNQSINGWSKKYGPEAVFLRYFHIPSRYYDTMEIQITTNTKLHNQYKFSSKIQ